MKIIKTSKFDGKTNIVTLDEVIEKTEKTGHWKPGTVEEMLNEGQEVFTPFATFKKADFQ